MTKSLDDMMLEILFSPERHVGIKGTLWGAKSLSVQDGVVEVAEIDILLNTGERYSHPYHVIALKPNEHYRMKALMELKFAENFIMDTFKTGCHKYFVCPITRGKYKVEEV